ncbi:MAG: hypothetical protein Q9170_001404 [Blastenia crenularia]
MAVEDLKENHDSEIYGIVITFMILAITAVALRFFTVIKLRSQKPVLDDYMMAVSLLIYTLSLLQPCTLALTKLAVLRLFHQIFTTRPFRLAINMMAVVVVLWWFGNFFADMLICIPVNYNWDQTILHAHCGNHRLLYIVTPIPWIVTDLTVLVLPLPMAWGLQMPRKQKVALLGVFLLGGLYVESKKNI